MGRFQCFAIAILILGYTASSFGTAVMKGEDIRVEPRQPLTNKGGQAGPFILSFKVICSNPDAIFDVYTMTAANYTELVKSRSNFPQFHPDASQFNAKGSTWLGPVLIPGGLWNVVIYNPSSKSQTFDYEVVFSDVGPSVAKVIAISLGTSLGTCMICITLVVGILFLRKNKTRLPPRIQNYMSVVEDKASSFRLPKGHKFQPVPNKDDDDYEQPVSSKVKSRTAPRRSSFTDTISLSKFQPPPVNQNLNGRPAVQPEPEPAFRYQSIASEISPRGSPDLGAVTPIDLSKRTKPTWDLAPKSFDSTETSNNNTIISSNNNEKKEPEPIRDITPTLSPTVHSPSVPDYTLADVMEPAVKALEPQVIAQKEAEPEQDDVQSPETATEQNEQPSDGWDTTTTTITQQAPTTTEFPGIDSLVSNTPVIQMEETEPTQEVQVVESTQEADGDVTEPTTQEITESTQEEQETSQYEIKEEEF